MIPYTVLVLACVFSYIVGMLTMSILTMARR
jgi:hypothetical protein